MLDINVSILNLVITVLCSFDRGHFMNNKKYVLWNMVSAP